MATETDPVCGMQIEESKAAGKSGYEGKTYYFCSNVCKTEFDDEPEKYVTEAKERQARAESPRPTLFYLTVKPFNEFGVGIQGGVFLCSTEHNTQ